ncbi:MAG TPA: cation diffusion facilitator family transporter [Caproicibacter sp.]|nr:cation diffusion facilitator family transporter [Caproicibacter sp.]
MTRFLIRLFIHDYKNTESNEVRQSYGKFSGIVGICTNLLLFIIKIIAGTLSNSIAITADAVNNLSDFASSIITLFGFKVSSKPADRQHPYGHARFEYISGLIVSIMIFIVGFQFAQNSINKIINPQSTDFNLLSAGVLVASILLKLWQGSFYQKVGKRIHSDTLMATAADSRSDVISTSIVLAGALITRFTGYNLDGYLGTAVAVLIMVTGFQLIRKTSGPLLGEAPSTELVDDIYRTIQKNQGVIGVHDLTVHNYGPGRCFASIHCEVPAERDILVSHDIIDNIEKEFLTKKGIHLVIHMDPIITNDERANALKIEVHKMVQNISPEITMHDFRVVWGPTHSNLVFDVCVPFEFKMSDGQIVETVSEGIQKMNPHYYSVITVDHDYVPTKNEEESATKN